jgi:hypothetical protein
VPRKEERVYLTPARVPASYSGEVHWKLISGELWWSLALEKSRTVCVSVRRSRRCGRRPRPFPGTTTRGGRRRFDVGALWLYTCASNSLRDEERRDVKVVRQRVLRRARTVRGCGVVWDHRISVSLPAGMKNSGERFARPGGVSDGEKRGGLERRSRAFYRRGESDETDGH